MKVTLEVVLKLGAGHWDQLSQVVDKVHLSDQMAQRISDALNELSERAKGAVKRDIANYQAALDKLDEKRDRMFDMFTAGAINQEEYKRQSQRLKDERRQYTKLLEESQLSISDAWRVTAQKVFELASNMKSLWNQGNTLRETGVTAESLFEPSAGWVNCTL